MNFLDALKAKFAGNADALAAIDAAQAEQAASTTPAEPQASEQPAQPVAAVACRILAPDARNVSLRAEFDNEYGVQA